jgi:hypothetical protein
VTPPRFAIDADAGSPGSSPYHDDRPISQAEPPSQEILINGHLSKAGHATANADGRKPAAHFLAIPANPAPLTPPECFVLSKARGRPPGDSQPPRPWFFLSAAMMARMTMPDSTSATRWTLQQVLDTLPTFTASPMLRGALAINGAATTILARPTGWEPRPQ